jgi:hypothetical protein
MRREELDVDIAKAGKRLVIALVARVKTPEVEAQLLISVFRQVKVPHPLVIGQKRVDRERPFYPRLKRSARDGKPASLRPACRAKTVRVDLVKRRDNTDDLSRVKIKYGA